MAVLDRTWATVSNTPSNTSGFTFLAALAGFQNWSAKGVDGATYSYVAIENAKFECGHGTYTAASNSLSRDTVYDSTAGFGTKETFTSACTVFSTPLNVDLGTAGRQSLWIPIGAMKPDGTNGPAGPNDVETTTNKVQQFTLDFDPNTAQFAQFSIRMPKMWNRGTVTFVPVWSHPTTTTNFKVAWTLAGVALRDSVAADQAFGTAQQINDTGGTADTIYVGTESAAITIAGTPQAEDIVIFEISRNATDVTNDTLAVVARLVGITLYITTNAENDA